MRINDLGNRRVVFSILTMALAVGSTTVALAGTVTSATPSHPGVVGDSTTQLAADSGGGCKQQYNDAQKNAIQTMYDVDVAFSALQTLQVPIMAIAKGVEAIAEGG